MGRRPKQYRSDGICIICKEREIPEGYNSYCVECRLKEDRERWNKKSYEERQSKWLKYRYNKDYSWYEETYNEQDGKCAICRKTIFLKGDHGPNKACVDHCHNTDEVRGLLCNHCNRALGMLDDSIENLQNAINYLRKYNGQCNS